MTTLELIATQFVGTLTLRPYVFGFLAVFLLAASRDLGWARAVRFLFWGGGVALAAELASTRVGVPFGLYHYTGETRGAELFLSNVPFFSPLSFPFLAYAGFCLARVTFGPTWAASRGGRVRTVLASGVLMMLLDVVIDPLAVYGDRWFLGHIFDYPDGGLYFGVPLSNFLGWLLVGWATVGGFVWAGESASGSPALGVSLYYVVLLVNLSITLWIGEWFIGGVGIVVHLTVFLVLYAVSRVTVGRWSAQPLSVPVTSSGGPTS
ncbi:MAG TPA: carotenoid biosynthesis protein [Candidatus Nitrosotalea sp.]|nr:carotenoid biosynthesis protein [Candidatus Nitrosotalea sp.]